MRPMPDVEGASYSLVCTSRESVSWRARELQPLSFRDAYAWPHRSDLWPPKPGQEDRDHRRMTVDAEAGYIPASPSVGSTTPRPRSLTEASVVTAKPWQLVHESVNFGGAKGPTKAVAPGGSAAHSTEVSRAWRRQKAREHNFALTIESSVERKDLPPAATLRATLAGPLSRAGRNLSSVQDKPCYKDWIRAEARSHVRALCAGLQAPAASDPASRIDTVAASANASAESATGEAAKSSSQLDSQLGNADSA